MQKWEPNVEIEPLAFFCAATEQDHKRVAVLAKMDAIAWAEGDTPFGHALPYGLHIAQVAGFNPRERGSNLQSCGRIELGKPVLERCFSLFSDIDTEFNHKKQ